MLHSRTVDINLFKPIKSITALTLNDSQHLNLLAVSHSGVRIYMSTSYDLKYNNGTNFDQTVCRPRGLYVIHVRLPPGYTPNTTFMNTPKQIHSVFYDKSKFKHLFSFISNLLFILITKYYRLHVIYVFPTT